MSKNKKIQLGAGSQETPEALQNLTEDKTVRKLLSLVPKWKKGDPYPFFTVKDDSGKDIKVIYYPISAAKARKVNGGFMVEIPTSGVRRTTIRSGQDFDLIKKVVNIPKMALLFTKIDMANNILFESLPESRDEVTSKEVQSIDIEELGG